jgi:DNA-binding NtrC family response regulator
MHMPWLSPADRKFLKAVGDLTFCNPFLPERLKHEQRALGRRTAGGREVWAFRSSQPEPREELGELSVRLSGVIDAALNRLSESKTKPTAAEAAIYEDAVVYLIYDRYRQRLLDNLTKGAPKLSSWAAFQAEFDRYFQPAGLTLPSGYEPAHLLACYAQACHAFNGIFKRILGGSPRMAELRAATWQSIFTHDMRAYYRGVYRQMADFTTLIVGPSGTGKELVAKAIAGARYIPFDTQRSRFTQDPAASYFPVNLASLPTQLIESELFGHTRGAFTDAVADHVGYLEACPQRGTVFLDEIGDLDPTVQVKLLRTLQERQFSRLGETKVRDFAGKIVAATHRDLPTQIAADRFRADLYYRLCSDVIQTPALAEVLAESLDDLPVLVRYLACRAVGDDQNEADRLAQRTLDWIERQLGAGYAWPGNIRELEQCVRGVLIRGRYEPARTALPQQDPAAALAQALQDGSLTAEQAITNYAGLVYGQTGSYVATAEVLNLDRRTVKRHVEASLKAGD